MSEQATAGKFPTDWQIASDFDPNNHMLNLKGKDYLGVQHRLLWFIKDQRRFISLGLAKMPYSIHTECIEMDTAKGFAHFKTTVRDVLGNEATMYGSEQAKDFGDYAEKASTKSLGRALLMLGYGTAFAPEMDEGERVVDSPLERRNTQQRNAPQTTARQQPPAATQQRTSEPAPEVTRDDARPVPLPTQSGPTGNYNPLADATVRKAAAAVGYSTVKQFETFMDEATGGDRAHVTQAQLLNYAAQLEKRKAKAS